MRDPYVHRHQGKLRSVMGDRIQNPGRSECWQVEGQHLSGHGVWSPQT